jgi:hypothetical protein
LGDGSIGREPRAAVGRSANGQQTEPIDIYSRSKIKAGDLPGLLSKDLKRRSVRTALSPFCDVTELLTYANNGHNYCDQRRQHSAGGTVEKSDTWENVICACHHHGCTTDGRRTDNK